MYEKYNTVLRAKSGNEFLMAKFGKVGALTGVQGVGMWYAECIAGESESDVAAMWGALAK